MNVPRIVDPLGLWPRALRASARTQADAVDAAGRLAVAVVRRLGEWPYASSALEVAVASPAVDRAVCTLAEGPLPQLIVDRLFEGRLPQQLVERLLADGIAEQIAERILAGPELERLVAEVLESPALERVAAQAIADPATTRLVEQTVGSAQVEDLLGRVLDSEGMERLVARVIDSRVVEVGVAHLLASDELWRMVDEIAQSPAVTEAISHQSVGFADQVAGEVGERSRHADAWLERAARRMLRRPPLDPGAAAPGTP